MVAILLCTFASVFLTAALSYGAWERFRGGTPTFASCMSAARARLHVIVPWAILAGLVGFVLEVLYRLPRFFRHMEQAGRHIPVVGQFAAIGAMIVAIALEYVWYFVTYLVVPVLVVEETGPIASCKRSFGLFRKTWGKSLIAQVGFELIGFLLFLRSVPRIPHRDRRVGKPDSPRGRHRHRRGLAAGGDCGPAIVGIQDGAVSLRHHGRSAGRVRRHRSEGVPAMQRSRPNERLANRSRIVEPRGLAERSCLKRQLRRAPIWLHSQMRPRQDSNLQPAG